MREIRIKINCVVEVADDTIPRVDPLDLIEHGVSRIKATKILPGARVTLGYTRAQARLLRKKS